jgi:hypothetical protein
MGFHPKPVTTGTLQGLGDGVPLSGQKIRVVFRPTRQYSDGNRKRALRRRWERLPFPS